MERKTLAVTGLVMALAWPASAFADDMIQCLRMFGHLRESGLVIDTDFAEPRPVIVVDESQWRRMNSSLRAKVAEMTQCILGENGYSAPAEFRSATTRRLLATLANGRFKESK